MEGEARGVVTLRPLEPTDLDEVFEQMRDPRAVAMAAFVSTRPLHARAVSDNVGSLRVLERNGFRVVGTDAGYAPGRGTEVQETLLRLD